MLRAVLVGLLAVSATSSCSDTGDTPKVAPGAVAGHVVEASGRALASRNGASRALIAGTEVFADDVIDTANGSVLILLHHNNARWAVESGQRTRVDESLAWKLAKQDRPAQAVEHASSAAGREGERTAADTRATSESVPAQAPPPPPPAPPAPEPRTADEGGAGADAVRAPKGAAGGGGGGGRGRAAAPRIATEDRDAVDVPPAPVAGPAAAIAQAPAKALAPAPATPEVRLRGELEARRAELRRCVGDTLEPTLVVRVAGGAAAIELTGAATSAEVRACLERIVRQIPMAGLTATASIALTR